MQEASLWCFIRTGLAVREKMWFKRKCWRCTEDNGRRTPDNHYSSSPEHCSGVLHSVVLQTKGHQHLLLFTGTKQIKKSCIHNKNVCRTNTFFYGPNCHLKTQNGQEIKPVTTFSPLLVYHLEFRLISITSSFNKSHDSWC